MIFNPIKIIYLTKKNKITNLETKQERKVRQETTYRKRVRDKLEKREEIFIRAVRYLVAFIKCHYLLNIGM